MGFQPESRGFSRLANVRSQCAARVSDRHLGQYSWLIMASLAGTSNSSSRHDCTNSGTHIVRTCEANLNWSTVSSWACLSPAFKFL